MKLAQFRTKTDAAARVGVLVEEKLLDVTALAADMNELIMRGDAALAEVRVHVEKMGGGAAEEAGVAFALGSVEFLPPVRPSKILAIGRNYVDHAMEEGEPPPAAPLVFTKLPNSLSAHLAPVVLSEITSQVDYEAELAVVIGRRARRVKETEALDYVFGYTLINDVSARDLQFGDGQWVRGKSLDGFAPLGPFITTRDEVADVHALKIEGRLNGAAMQSSNTGKMLFKVPYLISYISQGITLEAGDVIATGTPEGVGIFRKPPVLLKDGDVFEVEIEGLGTLKNPVVASGI